MVKRVFTALIMATLGVVALVVSANRLAASIILAFLTITCLYEVCNLSGKKRDFWVFVVGSAVAVGCVFIENIPYLKYISLALFVAALAVYGVIIVRAEKNKLTRPTLPLLIFTALMLIVFFVGVTEMRVGEYGTEYLVIAILTSVITDTAALFVGCKFGKHKLAPVVSPKKTVEGAVGGFVFAVLVCCGAGAVIKYFLNTPVNFPMLALYAALASVVGQFGDLTMSALKRGAGVKDFGNILPGHGGFLDRFDNMIFVWVLTYLFTVFGLGFVG